MEEFEMLKVIFDSSALITCCKFKIQSHYIMEHILRICEVFIPDAVRAEAGMASEKYPDATVAERMIREGAIKVQCVELQEDGVLDRYKLGKGEKEAITLAIDKGEAFVVTDDRLAYVVINRMKIKKLLFLDLLIELVEQKLIEREVAEQIVAAVKSRYPEGFIYHTLKILERGDRRCLR
jgi:predicted nucleic acid-binding protein